MNKFVYNGRIVTAASKEQAIRKIVLARAFRCSKCGREITKDEIAYGDDARIVCRDCAEDGEWPPERTVDNIGKLILNDRGCPLHGDVSVEGTVTRRKVTVKLSCARIGERDIRRLVVWLRSKTRGKLSVRTELLVNGELACTL